MQTIGLRKTLDVLAKGFAQRGGEGIQLLCAAIPLFQSGIAQSFGRSDAGRTLQTGDEDIIRRGDIWDAH
tara:strand:- start:366 stop:575 length:210 start_codon:yes stop_codon:yes gene_type:complete